MPFFPEFVDVVQTTNINDGAVTLVKMADLAQNTVIGRHASAGTGVPEALTQTQLTALVSPASASLPGSMSVIDFNKLNTMPATAPVLSYLVSDSVDVTGTNSFNFPSYPGYYFWVISNSRSITLTAAGVATGGVSLKIGNNANHDNICTTSTNSPATAAHAARLTSTNPVIGGGSLVVSSNVELLDLTTAPTGVITTAATGTGLFAWTCRYVLLGIMIKASAL